MYAFLLVLGLTPDCRQRVAACLGSLERSRDKDWVSPLVPMGSWASQDACRVKLVNEVWDWCNLSDLPSHLLLRETKERGKTGTGSVRRAYRSVGADGFSLQGQCEKFFSPRKVCIDETTMAAVVRSVIREFGPSERLRCVDLSTAVDSFEGKTNLGYPCFTSDRRYLPLMTSESEYLLASLDREFLLEHIPLLWTRLQPVGAGLPAKTRAIFQCSRVVGNLEKMIQIPLHKHLRSKPTFAAWISRAAVDNAMTEMMEEKGWFLSVDYENFDATVHPRLVDAVFEVLRTWFSGCAQLLDLLQYGFNNVGLITPDGLGSEIRTGGVPSGSVLTSVLGSLANLIATQYAAVRTGHTIRRCVILGDDAVNSFRTKPDVAAMSNCLLTELGMVLNPDKSFLHEEEAHFLQMLHHVGYRDERGIIVGVRSLVRIWNKMMNLSGYVKWGPELHTLRWRQQMGDGKTHPSFSKLLECYKRHDKKFHDTPAEALIKAAGGLGTVSAALARGEGDLSLEELTSDVVERGLKALS